MDRKAIVLTLGAMLWLGSPLMVCGDTKAPNAQTFDLQCNGMAIRFVSPGEHALAAQAVGSTSVGILLRLTSGADVLFQLPAFTALPAGNITECTSGPLTFTILLTPPR